MCTDKKYRFYFSRTSHTTEFYWFYIPFSISALEPAKFARPERWLFDKAGLTSASLFPVRILAEKLQDKRK